MGKGILRRARPCWVVAAGLLTTVAAGQVHYAPPAPPEVPPHPGEMPVLTPQSGSPALYSIGDPTGKEQEVLELINRARADAGAEALRLANTTDPDVLNAIGFFGVDLNQMITEFGTLDQSVQPLSFNADLIEAARLHSQDMFNNVFQGHVSSANPPAPFAPGDTSSIRAQKMGYPSAFVGENVFTNSLDNPFYAHAAFSIDWGTLGSESPAEAADGMQDPPGHRENIHRPEFTEIGIGILEGTNSNGSGSVGPLLITQDFGDQGIFQPFITGVAYFDLDGDNFYDAGEGIGGVRVDVPGASYYAVTSDSGGYSIPVTGNGSYTVTFSGQGFAETSFPANVSNGENVKVDFAPTFVAPAVFGPASVEAGETAVFGVGGGVPGADGYSVTICRWEAGDLSDDAEDDSGFIDLTGPAIDLRQTQEPTSGSFSFHMAFLNPPDSDEIFELDGTFLAGDSASLQFSSALSTMNTDNNVYAEVSTDGGATWQVVWTQPGPGDLGGAVPPFTQVSVDLSSFAGESLRLRMRLSIDGGFFFVADPDNRVTGWFLDDVTLTGGHVKASQTQTTMAPDGTFSVTGNTPGELVTLEVSPNNGSKTFAAGATSLDVTAQQPEILTQTLSWNEGAQQLFIEGQVLDAPIDSTIELAVFLPDTINGGLFDTGFNFDLGTVQADPQAFSDTVQLNFPEEPAVFFRVEVTEPAP